MTATTTVPVPGPLPGPAAARTGTLTRASLARRGALAHRAGLTATALVLALAGALLAATTVLLTSGLAAGGLAGGQLVALASSFAGTALVVVVLVVAATVNLTLRHRRRELALLRAVGATRPQVRHLVRRELLLVTAVAAPLGAVPGLALPRLLDPMLRDAGVAQPRLDPALTPVPLLIALALLLPTALVAARLAVRETLRRPATAAVADSAAESGEIGPVRRATALALALAGLAVALAPVAVSGVLGSATAASSAFLLVGAAALSGPLLVTWTLAHVTRLPLLRWGAGSPAGRLAVANVRGFSRRLTTVVVPLALMVSVGTIQGSVARALAAASHEQLAAAVRTDVVVAGPGLDEARVTGAGVASVTPLGSIVAQVRTDDEDVPLAGALSWEPMGVRVVPAGVGREVFDPGVVAGSLRALARPDTIAVSEDARLDVGAGLGGTVTLRYGGALHHARVVAVFSRGLGVGDLLAGAEALRAEGVRVGPDTLLVEARPGSAGDVVASLRRDHQPARRTADYVAASVGTAAAGQRLSTALVLLLLGFAGLGAANALVVATAGRREELELLRRTGTTRRQLLRMAFVEALLTATAAWLIGTVAVLPAVVGVSAGLLGVGPVAFDTATYAGLSLSVLLIPLTCTVGAAARLTRPRAA